MGHSRTGDIAGQQGLQIAGTPEQRRQVKPGRKNWITRNVWESIYFKRGIALSGYHFDFSDILKRYFVKQHGSIHEYYAIDKTALRSILYGRIEDIVEVSG